MSEIQGLELDKRGRPNGVARIVTGRETVIYLLPVETFPGHVNNVYLIDHPDHRLLFDVGTSSGHPQLLARIEEAATRFGLRTRLPDVSLAVISHAHLDHFGNARTVRELGIPLAIHELDARVLASFAERRALVSRDIGIFFLHAGVAPELSRQLVELYRIEKHYFSDLEPDRRLRNGDELGPGWRVLHVPGHCPGLLCLAVDDVVLTADHLLARITPIQSPQSITPFVGLENYLRSLEKLRVFGPFDLGLGAHEAPILDVDRRIDETMEHHARRLRQVHALCEDRARTIAEISLDLFGAQKRYGIILALLEAGAHVEFLHELGHLVIENVDSVSDDPAMAARYRAHGRLERQRARPPFAPPGGSIP